MPVAALNTCAKPQGVSGLFEIWPFIPCRHGIPINLFILSWRWRLRIKTEKV